MALFSRPPATHLPPVAGVRLDGTPVSLPEGLTEAATLVVLTFQDDAAPISSQWARLGRRIAAAMPGLGVLEVSVFPPRMRLLGEIGLISVKSRADIDAAHTAVVYVKRKPFRKALGISSDDGVTALLVGRDGTIVWRGEDQIDLIEIETLEPAVRELLEGEETVSEPAASSANPSAVLAPTPPDAEDELL